MVSSVLAQVARSTRVFLSPTMNDEIVRTDVGLVSTPVSVWYCQVLIIFQLGQVSWTAFSQQPPLSPHLQPIAKPPPIILIQWTLVFIHRRWANKIFLSDLSIFQSWNAAEVSATVLMGDVVAELLVWDTAALVLTNQLALRQWKSVHNIFCTYFVAECWTLPFHYSYHLYRYVISFPLFYKVLHCFDNGQCSTLTIFMETGVCTLRFKFLGTNRYSTY